MAIEDFVPKAPNMAGQMLHVTMPRIVVDVPWPRSQEQGGQLIWCGPDGDEPLTIEVHRDTPRVPLNLINLCALVPVFQRAHP